MLIVDDTCVLNTSTAQGFQRITAGAVADAEERVCIPYTNGRPVSWRRGPGERVLVEQLLAALRGVEIPDHGPAIEQALDTALSLLSYPLFTFTALSTDSYNCNNSLTNR